MVAQLDDAICQDITGNQKQRERGKERERRGVGLKGPWCSLELAEWRLEWLVGWGRRWEERKEEWCHEEVAVVLLSMYRILPPHFFTSQKHLAFLTSKCLGFHMRIVRGYVLHSGVL